MDKSQAEKTSLCQLIQEMIPLLGCSDSIARFIYTVENLESDIQNLEARVETIQQEIEILIAEQYNDR